jgi:glyoxylase-like metal-dependent hydrolase (beta-lactamase superfamily II)
MMSLRAITLFLTAILVAMCVAVQAQPAAPAQARPTAPSIPVLTSPRLYVIDCGTIVSNEPERFGVTRDEVYNLNFSDPCFLVVHPKGILLFDTGLSDLNVGRPIYQTMVGKEAQVKFNTLLGNLADIGVTPAKITYLALSHSHWDHVGNANDYAGSIWLARRAEYDFMFSPQQRPENLRNYRELLHAQTKFIEGDYDVFGDGTVILLSTPGHSPGHQSLYVKLRHTGGVVIAGDLYHYTQERTLGRIPSREVALGTPESRAKIDRFLESTHSQLWIDHAIDWYAQALKAPAWYD